MSSRSKLRPALRGALSLRASVVLGVVAALWAAAPDAQAGTVSLGDAADYALVYEGNGGKKIQINEATIGGNVGIGGTGKAELSGNSVDLGTYAFDFYAADTGQFSDSGSGSTYDGPNFGVTAVNNALTRMNALSKALHDELASGASIAIDSATQTVNASDGASVSVTFDGQTQTFRLFTVTSGNNLKNGNGVLTINGSANDLIAFNLEDLAAFEFKNDIVLTGGITEDNIVWNLGGGNYATLSGGTDLKINNGGSSGDSTSNVARGIFLNPNGQLSVVHSWVVGRVFAGGTYDAQWVSGADISAPVTLVPLPSSAWMGLSLLGVAGALGAVRRRRQRSELI